MWHLGSWLGDSIVLFTAFWHMGRGRFGGENQKFRSLKSEIRYSSEDVEYICLEFRAEIGTGGLILESSGIGSI